MKRIALLSFVLTALIFDAGMPAFAENSASKKNFKHCLKKHPCKTRKTGEQLNQIEPAAGPVQVPVPRPDPYTNPDQEQNEQNKSDWWHEDWSPPEEANPYHKW